MLKTYFLLSIERNKIFNILQNSKNHKNCEIHLNCLSKWWKCKFFFNVNDSANANPFFFSIIIANNLNAICLFTTLINLI